MSARLNRSSLDPLRSRFITRRMAKQAPLSIRFVIVGGGIAGLASAIALRRVGHEVIVLERDESLKAAKTEGGIRLAPNVSKIFYHWGLESQVREIAVTSTVVQLHLFETGELLGRHTYEEEVLRETQGDFLLTHRSSLREMLYEAAKALGAVIVFGATVKEVDVTQGTVLLSSGVSYTADVIVGADGPSGVTRQAFPAEDTLDIFPVGMYSAMIPLPVLKAEPELASLFKDPTTQVVWFGHGHALYTFNTGTGHLALHLYAPGDAQEGYWDGPAISDKFCHAFGTAEPRLRRLGDLVSSAIFNPVRQSEVLEEWTEGRLVMIGEAVHPMPGGSLQSSAMAVEDGAVLAKLFSHLRRRDQIPSFLEAFQEIREARTHTVSVGEHNIYHFVTLPPGVAQAARDTDMRKKRDAGRSPLEGDTDEEESPQWRELKEIFGYDAEDAADDWWVQWGLLRERAHNLVRPGDGRSSPALEVFKTQQQQAPWMVLIDV